jgi:cardiolipin synthase
MKDWTTGNKFRLLENGEEFFPRLSAAIDSAEKEVVLRTFIWLEDAVGIDFAGALTRAARRGVDVNVTVDGFGTPGFSEEFLRDLSRAGVKVLSFDPQPTFLHLRTNVFCRLHDKVAVIDRRIAFVGGINICEHHLRSYGDRSLQDYAVEIEGPAVKQIHRSSRGVENGRKASPLRRWRHRLRRLPREIDRPSEDGQALFVTRDNQEHTTDIESMYRLGFRAAKRDVTIANAYFFPSYRFIRDLVSAARRGVKVKLILQGNPDVPISAAAASLLYNHLLSEGIEIYHYTERPLHAKVAVIDGVWATVGSSNLDPTSLGFNLEANVFTLDRGFASALTQSLSRLLETSCESVRESGSPARSFWGRLVPMLIYYLTYKMPRWGRIVLRRGQRTKVLEPS